MYLPVIFSLPMKLPRATHAFNVKWLSEVTYVMTESDRKHLWISRSYLIGRPYGTIHFYNLRFDF